MTQENESQRNPKWEMYWALREQWTHEDTLINHRSMWMILSQGLLLTAYGTLSQTGFYWVSFGFPIFGMAVTALVGSSIYAALAAADAVRKRHEAAGLSALCQLVADPRHNITGTRATRVLPFVFGTIWLLALAGAIRATTSP